MKGGVLGAKPLKGPPSTKTYAVCVFPPEDRKRRGGWTAYVRNYNVQWKGAIIVEPVFAFDNNEAKRLAINLAKRLEPGDDTTFDYLDADGVIYRKVYYRCRQVKACQIIAGEVIT